MNDDLKQLIDQLGMLFDNVREAQIKTLEDTADLQVTMRTLLQHEQTRLEHKLGGEHPRLQRMNGVLKRNFEISRDLEVEREIARIRVPEPQEDGLLIHGRVTDEHRRGIHDLIVFAEDANGRPLRAFGTATTDASGHYVISLDPKSLGRLQGTDVFLTVRTRADKVVHHEAKPLELASGERKLVEVVLDTPGHPGEVFKPPFNRVSEPEIDSDLKPEDLKGVGPKTAEKLKEAGIKNALAFAEADEATLQDIMGKVNIHKIKQDNADLLKKVRRSRDKK